MRLALTRLGYFVVACIANAVAVVGIVVLALVVRASVDE